MSNVIYLTGRDRPADILLVEEDPLIRITTASHLRKVGHSVVEAADGTEALTLLRAGRKISLVFGALDGLGGQADLVALLQREFPAVKLLVGYARHTEDIPTDGSYGIGRPYDLQEVEKAVNTLLNPGFHT